MQANENNITIAFPSTVYIRFTGEMPKLFVITDSSGEVEYFRYMDGKTPRIKFNLPIPGVYYPSVPFEISKVVNVEIPPLPVLPPASRNRYHGKWPDVVYDPSWTISPASIMTDQNLIIHGPLWQAQIPAVGLFIDLHECGHLFYAEEENCDLYAFVNFMLMGYNRSTAYYALDKVLKSTPQNIERIKTMFSTVQKYTSKIAGDFDPGY